MKILQFVSKPFLSNSILVESLLASRSKISRRNSRRNVIGLTQKANDTRNIIHATPGFEPGELLTLPTRHRYNSLQAWPLLPSSASSFPPPLSSTSIPEKAGHCRVEIVRNYDNSSAGLGEINENSRGIYEEGVKKGMRSPQKQIFRP